MTAIVVSKATMHLICVKKRDFMLQCIRSPLRLQATGKVLAVRGLPFSPRAIVVDRKTPGIYVVDGAGQRFVRVKSF